MSAVKWLLLWLIVFAAIGTIGHQPWMNYYRLNKRGAETPGIALARRPNLQIGYSFNVNGRTYQAIGRARLEGHEISSGDQVLVHYLPDDPKISCLGDPQKLLRSELPATVISDFLFSTIIVGLLAFGMKKKMASQQGAENQAAS